MDTKFTHILRTPMFHILTSTLRYLILSVAILQDILQSWRTSQATAFYFLLDQYLLFPCVFFFSF